MYIFCIDFFVIRFLSIGIFITFATPLWGQDQLVTHSLTVKQKVDLTSGLSQRQLYPLAEKLLRQYLQEKDLSPAVRRRLGSQLIEVVVSHALSAPLEEGRPLWEKSLLEIQAQKQFFLGSDLRYYFDFQEIVCHLDYGKKLHSAARREGSSDHAKAEFRLALSLLEKTKKNLQKRLIELGSQTNSPSKNELVNLQNFSTLLAGKIYLEQASTYSSRSTEQTDLLLQTARQFEASLGTHPIESRLGLVRCNNLLGKIPEARDQIEALEKLGPHSPLTVLEIRGEKIRIFLLANDWERLEQTLQKGRTFAGKTSPYLDMALLETALSLWQKSIIEKDEQAITKHQTQVFLLSHEIQQLYGRHWQAQSGQLLVNKLSDIGLDNIKNLDLLATLADQYYLQKEYEQASTIYQYLGEHFVQKNDIHHAFSSFLKKGLVKEQQGNLQGAIADLSALAEKWPTQSQSSQTHWHALLLQASLVQKDPRNLDAYQTILEKHLHHWPKSDQANQANLYLGKLYLRQNEWDLAAACFWNIRDNQETSPSGIALAADALKQKITQSAVAAQKSQTIENTLATLETYYLANNKLPTTWSPNQAIAAGEFADIALSYRARDFPEIETLLYTLLTNPPQDLSADKLRHLRATYLLSIAGQENKVAQAHT
ncbi:MAG: hypothetical protein MPJ24_10005, partial [Pirellulaceae bacterium]|nr:hypothetical protein [Pirellulaceae bacterium]